jgi:hypothetical protein
MDAMDAMLPFGTASIKHILVRTSVPQFLRAPSLIPRFSVAAQHRPGIHKFRRKKAKSCGSDNRRGTNRDSNAPSPPHSLQAAACGKRHQPPDLTVEEGSLLSVLLAGPAEQRWNGRVEDQRAATARVR